MSELWAQFPVNLVSGVTSQFDPNNSTLGTINDQANSLQSVNGHTYLVTISIPNLGTGSYITGQPSPAPG